MAVRDQKEWDSVCREEDPSPKEFTLTTADSFWVATVQNTHSVLSVYTYQHGVVNIIKSWGENPCMELSRTGQLVCRGHGSLTSRWILMNSWGSPLAQGGSCTSPRSVPSSIQPAEGSTHDEPTQRSTTHGMKMKTAGMAVSISGYYISTNVQLSLLTAI